jgi:hypothetical protein
VFGRTRGVVVPLLLGADRQASRCGMLYARQHLGTPSHVHARKANAAFPWTLVGCDAWASSLLHSLTHSFSLSACIWSFSIPEVQYILGVNYKKQDTLKCPLNIVYGWAPLNPSAAVLCLPFVVDFPTLR